MAESSAINKSLSVLGQVVHALNQGAVSLLLLQVLSFLLIMIMGHSHAYRIAIPN
jgi:hypothetical protein